MKKVKLISLALSMLVCFISKAQEKMPIEKAIVIETKSLVATNSTKIADVKLPTNFPKQDTSRKIRIVCMKTISKTNEPLYILDGIQVNTKKIAEINPNDIKEIKVLKGIDATSIYGSQAVNGVVIITTKTKNNQDNTEE